MLGDALFGFWQGAVNGIENLVTDTIVLEGPSEVCAIGPAAPGIVASIEPQTSYRNHADYGRVRTLAFGRR